MKTEVSVQSLNMLGFFFLCSEGSKCHVKVQSGTVVCLLCRFMLRKVSLEFILSDLWDTQKDEECVCVCSESPFRRNTSFMGLKMFRLCLNLFVWRLISRQSRQRRAETRSHWSKSKFGHVTQNTVVWIVYIFHCKAEYRAEDGQYSALCQQLYFFWGEARIYPESPALKE